MEYSFSDVSDERQSRPYSGTVMGTVDVFADVPPEIVNKICKRLDTESLKNLSRSSRVINSQCRYELNKRESLSEMKREERIRREDEAALAKAKSMSRGQEVELIGTSAKGTRVFQQANGAMFYFNEFGAKALIRPNMLQFVLMNK